MLLLIDATASAYDFAVKNEDGVTIYYEEINSIYLRVEVTSGPSKYSGIVNIPSSVTYEGTTYRITDIGDSSFSNCTELTEVTIPNSVFSINRCAFSNCTGLTKITIPESVTSIEEYAFEYCTGLTEVNFNAKDCYMGDTYHGTYLSVFRGCYSCEKLTIGNNVQSIDIEAFSGLNPDEVTFNATNCTDGYDAFKNCSVGKLTIGNNVQSIPNYVFRDCRLGEVTIPESVTSIGERAFYNSIVGFNTSGYSWRGFIVKPTQTTFSSTITSFKNWKCNKQFYLKFNGAEYEFCGEEITVDGLIPERTYELSVYISINGCKIELTTFESTTKDVSISREALKTATSVMLIPNVDAGDAVVSDQHWTDKENGEPLYITGLDPNTTYTYNYVVEGESWTRKKEFTVKTDELTMLTLPGQAMNTTTALLCSETNICDDEVNVGFEWRRHDAPSTLPSNKVACAAIDGTITGALSGLNPEVYYNYRPYYTSNSGKTYYGEWITFFTGDANVFFDPTVKTYSAEVLDDYSAVLKGYALRGSEEIASQGFQYWKSWGAPNGSRSNEVAEVEVKGQKLSCTIADLDPGSTYTYRTFVKTASGITYGEEMTFDTPGSAGIEETIAETTEVVITGYYNLQGVKSDRPFSGLNIVSYSDGTTKKVIYRK